MAVGEWGNISVISVRGTVEALLEKRGMRE